MCLVKVTVGLLSFCTYFSGRTVFMTEVKRLQVLWVFLKHNTVMTSTLFETIKVPEHIQGAVPAGQEERKSRGTHAQCLEHTGQRRGARS